MARGKRGRQAANHDDFKGPDHDADTIERLSAAAASANAKAGHNSGAPPDEVVARNFDAIELAWTEIDAAARIMQRRDVRIGRWSELAYARAACRSSAGVGPRRRRSRRRCAGGRGSGRRSGRPEP